MRFKITYTFYYNVKKKDLKDNYSTDSFDKALKIDINNAKEDPWEFFDTVSNGKIKVKGELIYQ